MDKAPARAASAPKRGQRLVPGSDGVNQLVGSADLENIRNRHWRRAERKRLHMWIFASRTDQLRAQTRAADVVEADRPE